MFIELLGWISTLLVLIGYFLNSKQQLKKAITVWLVGDVGWIIYDIFITNWSHLALSGIIIAINLYGIYNILKGKQ